MFGWNERHDRELVICEITVQSTAVLWYGNFVSVHWKDDACSARRKPWC